MKNLKQNLSNIVVCLFEAVIGILLLINPVGFTSGILVVFGIVLMLTGLINVIKYFRMESEEAVISQNLMKGLILLAAGGFCTFNFTWFIITFPLLSIIYGVMTLLVGFNKIQWAVDMLRMKKKKWFLAAISAVISIMCTVVILKNPFTSSTVLWMFAGSSLIVEAIFDMIALILNGRNKIKTSVDVEEESEKNGSTNEETI